MLVTMLAPDYHYSQMGLVTSCHRHNNCTLREHNT